MALSPSHLPPPLPSTAAPSPVAADAASDLSVFDQWLPAQFGRTRWLGWRLRLLIALALAGCIGLFLLKIGRAHV